jgi:hypothetical protein
MANSFLKYSSFGSKLHRRARAEGKKMLKETNLQRL